MPVPSLPFAISVGYAGDRVDALVEGSLDAVGGAVLRMLLEHVAVDGDNRVTLDLADVDVGRSGRPGLLEAQMAAQVDPTAVADAALRLVTTLAQATVAGADGVSVSLQRHGSFVTVAASDDRIEQMDRDQYSTGQGPCLMAATTGQPVRVDKLAEETRWPEFVPRALTGGIASILSSPLLLPAGPVGALNMYCKKERGFGPRERELAALFAAQASGILAEATDRASPEAGERLHEALQTRGTIAQAQGILMARTGDSADQAYARLKLDARRFERSVREVALDLVASATRAEPDRSPHE